MFHGRVYIARNAVPIRTGAVPPRRKLQPVAIRRNPSFDVFNVRLLVAPDKMLREKWRDQGALSASINDALLGVDHNTVELVTLKARRSKPHEKRSFPRRDFSL